ncbi:protein of unknown function [Georgenia satyanarayanai]|uniref:DUF4180 domain-containing protein n=1 Tax=Georgenia satyanarayanai TaxID=860221 RepID=A0A2Y9ARG5_9MICO|nr:DUF4180 domain-containing protein [Georgenia satyanarayanai]PYF96329.1 uncharacterized protein DUF4180 [Georgenia satyanarayanai]SSA47051.1 protein of unknown function [Georgenia satyanarayanai]
MSVQTVGSTVVLHLPAQGSPIASEQDALDLVGDTWGTGAEVLAVPVERLAPEFFDLRTGLAGAVTQKLVSYHLRLAVLGDIDKHLEGSGALRDFVRESNRGRHVWFLADAEALTARLSGGAGSPA